jgi:hypothetical protein
MNIVMTKRLFKALISARAPLSQFRQIDRRNKRLGMRIGGIRHFTMVAALSLWPALAHAADTAAPPRPTQNGPLKPGRSAGVRTAQLPRTGLALIGASAIIAVVVVAASTGSGGGGSPQLNMQSVPTTTP